jgi:hypothetical protein
VKLACALFVRSFFITRQSCEACKIFQHVDRHVKPLTKVNSLARGVRIDLADIYI